MTEQITYSELCAEHDVDAGHHAVDIAPDAIVEIDEGWWADDGNAPIDYSSAESAAEAGEAYVDGGEWGQRDRTDWVDICTWRRAEVTDVDGERVELTIDRNCGKYEIEPIEPDCEDGKEHDWQAPYSVLGGLKENPGVWGHGGGVIYREVCAYCGRYRETDTWAQDMSDGTQGLRSVRYEDADEKSRKWIVRREIREVRQALDECDLVVSYEVREDCGDVVIVARDDSYDEDTGYLTDAAEHEVAEALPDGWSVDWVAGHADDAGRHMYVVERA